MANDILRDEIPNSTTENKTDEPKEAPEKVSGIYKHGKRWRIDTYYKFIQLRESFATFEMAESALRKMKTLIDEGRWLDKKKESTDTVGEVIKRYLKWCEDIRQKDLKSKKQRLGVVEEKLGKDTLLSKVTRADIENIKQTECLLFHGAMSLLSQPRLTENWPHSNTCSRKVSNGAFWIRILPVE